eukprot:13298749-Alexandrium_andersonii.AAC.1
MLIPVWPFKIQDSDFSFHGVRCNAHERYVMLFKGVLSSFEAQNVDCAVRCCTLRQTMDVLPRCCPRRFLRPI